MPLLATTGPIAEAQTGVRELIASSATFQSIVGVGSEAAALPFCYPAVELEPNPPYAIVGMPLTVTKAVRFFRVPRGNLIASFKFPVASIYCPDPETDSAEVASEKLANGMIQFCNQLGDILDHCLAESRQAGRTYLQSYTLQSPGCGRSEVKEADPFHWAQILFEYGTGGS